MQLLTRSGDATIHGTHATSTPTFTNSVLMPPHLSCGDRPRRTPAEPGWLPWATDASNGLCVSSFLGWSSLRAQHATTRSRRAGGDGLFGDLIPHLKSGGHVGGVLGGVHPVAGGRKCGKSDWKRPETVALNRQCGTLSSRVRVAWSVDGIFRTDYSSVCFAGAPLSTSSSGVQPGNCEVCR